MRWKTAQKKARLRRKVRVAALTLGLIIAIVLAGNFLRAIHTLFSPLSIQTNRTYNWDSNFNLNLVLNTNPLSVLSFNPVDNKIAILEIPDSAYIEVPGGYGSWKVGAIFKLGESEDPPKGAKLLRDSLQSFLSLPIDGVIVRQQALGSSEQFINDLRGNPWQALMAVTSARTDLSPVELTRFVMGVKGVRFDKITTYNLEELGLLNSDKLADGEDILVGDSTKIDALLARHFTDTKVLGEAATIAVFNATEKPGLAAKTAQLINHLGGNVIIQGSFGSEVSGSAVEGSKEFPYTTKRLQQIFGSGTLQSLDKSASDVSRASVNLILGK
jgi:hypothetical protein